MSGETKATINNKNRGVNLEYDACTVHVKLNQFEGSGSEKNVYMVQLISTHKYPFKHGFDKGVAFESLQQYDKDDDDDDIIKKHINQMKMNFV